MSRDRLVVIAAMFGMLPAMWLANAAALWSLWTHHIAPPLGAPTPGLAAWLAVLLAVEIARPIEDAPQPSPEGEVRALVWVVARTIFAVVVVVVSEWAP